MGNYGLNLATLLPALPSAVTLLGHFDGDFCRRTRIEITVLYSRCWLTGCPLCSNSLGLFHRVIAAAFRPQKMPIGGGPLDAQELLPEDTDELP